MKNKQKVRAKLLRIISNPNLLSVDVADRILETFPQICADKLELLCFFGDGIVSFEEPSDYTNKHYSIWLKED